MLKKIGENLTFDKSDILTPKKALADEKILKRFIKMAKQIRKVAPRANEFVYGHAIMMHAAEASLIDQETGNPIVKNNNPVKGWFEDFTNAKGQESIKWVSPDDIRPYKNANGDIFGERELLKAYKNWVGKPLCKDHVSDSVDGIRGIIIDTYYCPKFKRVHALFALDKKNYADLARKVETGYANSVSMGTGVGRSVCTECGNVAVTERDYCNCVRTRQAFGEINLDLSPIELSLVVNGADGLAKIRQIVASMNTYVDQKQARVQELVNDRCVNPTELQSLTDSLTDMQTKINALMGLGKKASNTSALIALMNRVDKETDVENLKLLLTSASTSQEREIIQKRLDEVSPAEPEAFSPTGGKVDFEPGPVSTNPSQHSVPDWIGSATEMGINPANRLAGIYEGLNILNKKIDKIAKMVQSGLSYDDLKQRAIARRKHWANNN